ncbi:disease resistance protein Roq1-like [Cryptomeria japonica]|uniref:disease resistance protein Roq1-like n=1 Tax=Cryptomeria japonica TaxID=3369 RepID=UPI0027DAA7C9|nr:disease resistance protein Roq1-like [Cryptomeria japonica]
MASSSSSHQRNRESKAFSGIGPAGERRMVSESSRVFDVFINHRGPDVKLTLATQLYNSLKDLHINSFLDSEEKKLGDSFGSTIETAILSAKVHIAIFSPRYAESPWCLDELVLMLQIDAKIIPVFYQVEPWELRRIETGVYADAFMKYEEKGRYLEKLKTWKEALRSISSIAGEEFNSCRDCQFQEIVEAVQKEVQRKTCLYVADYPVGLHKLVEDFERRFHDGLVEDMESKFGLKNVKNKAKMVGIFGMGGVGKTTLAKELCNRKKSDYIKSSFLFNVREADMTGQLPSLQLQLLKDLFDQKDFSFTSLEEGASHLKDCLRRSPLLHFLIVVDDIDLVKQLDDLLVMDIFKKSGNCLIIVTTRAPGVLITAGITDRYCLEGMDRNNGRELFCWHAFDQSYPSIGYEALVEAFVTVCKGLPLSLQVLGRHVRNRSKSYWDSELIKASKMLHRDIKQRLRISFDSLDDEEKQVFMDVACFFVGKPTSVATEILKGSGWNVDNAIETLKDKEMADELSPPHRLWRPQDLRSLELRDFKRLHTITNIRCFQSVFIESTGSQFTFFLGQSNICYEKSASLLWLQLENKSGEQPSIPSWIHLQNLPCLEIKGGRLKKLWKNHRQVF